MSVKKYVNEVRFSARDFLYNRKSRALLKNKDFSIISSDCLGGCIAKDLKVRMNSPTRNFYFNSDDYIKFCKKLEYYLGFEPQPYNGNYSGGAQNI